MFRILSAPHPRCTFPFAHVVLLASQECFTIFCTELWHTLVRGTSKYFTFLPLLWMEPPHYSSLFFPSLSLFLPSSTLHSPHRLLLSCVLSYWWCVFTYLCSLGIEAIVRALWGAGSNHWQAQRAALSKACSGETDVKLWKCKETQSEWWISSFLERHHLPRQCLRASHDLD